MNADANHGRHERIMLLRVYKHAVQPIIIQDTVVDAFRCGSLLIYLGQPAHLPASQDPEYKRPD